MTDSSSPLRLALVGVGPRGLYALERLARAARRGDLGPLHIDLFEPHPYPGAGPNYDPRQPTYLRMNFAADHIDAWGPRADDDAPGKKNPHENAAEENAAEENTAEAQTSPGPSFLRWLREAEDPAVARWADGDAFAPRALVGGYLHFAYRRVTRELRDQGVTLRHRRQFVRQLEPDPRAKANARWRLQSESDEWESYDEVLLTTGHGTSRLDNFGPQQRRQLQPHRTPVITRIDPVDELENTTLLPPGATVVLRGFALTFLDTAFALTEGRGGRFERQGPGRWRYHGSPYQVGRLVPFSRSGEPLLAKPHPSQVRAPDGLEPLFADGRERLHDLLHEPPPEGFATALRRLVEELTNAVLARAAIAADAPGTSRSDDGAPPDPAGHMQLSVEVALGQAPVDRSWARGEAWRHLYPMLAETLAPARLPPDERHAFDILRAELSRLTFGPPAESVAKLLALHRAEVLDLSFVHNPRLDTGPSGPRLIAASGHSLIIDALVDTVRGAPGCDAGSPLVGSLLRGGQARQLAGTFALETTNDGRPLAIDGRPVAGLAVIGRATEGCFMGLDTLSRTRHRTLDHWARRIAHRSLSPQVHTTATIE